MKWIKKYEGYFDPESALYKIADHYTEDVISKMLADEREEWSDNYNDYGNGEAEDHVIENLITWYEKESGQKLNDYQRDGLVNSIKDRYKVLA
jgi:hypothetical protein